MEKQNLENFFAAIEQLAKYNLLKAEDIVEIISESVKKLFHTKFDPDAELEFTIDKEKKEMKLVNKSKFVIDEEVAPEDRAIEISLKDAKKIDKSVKEGGLISEEVNFAAYSRVLAGRVRQMIVQSVREKKKAAVYAKHKGLKGEMVSATVVSSTPAHAT